MRATGIVRRVDDLGRVVIPRDVRHKLKIREGEALEIFIEDGMVCFKKYSPIGEQMEGIETILKKIKYSCKARIIVTDRDDVVCDTEKTPKNKYTDEFTKAIYSGDMYEDIPIYDGNAGVLRAEIVKEIISEGDHLGWVVATDVLDKDYAQAVIDVLAVVIGGRSDE